MLLSISHQGHTLPTATPVDVSPGHLAEVVCAGFSPVRVASRLSTLSSLEGSSREQPVHKECAVYSLHSGEGI